ncbi:MAG: hypothetical protein FWH05_07900 [Oscillospiraceae bacterium]|nr:hypothetical protein [Oscillospiraceae bacterium]
MSNDKSSGGAPKSASGGSPKSASGGAPDCFKCKHFYITWEQKSQKACRLFEFKSDRLPSVVVFKSTGKKCEGFEPKNERNLKK